MISKEDYLAFVGDALEGMIAIVEDLGDDLANRRPDLEGANTPYAILTHCLGVMAYWGGAVVAGRQVERDRPAEFRASGAVGPLVQRARGALARFTEDVAGAEPSSPPRGPAAAARGGPGPSGGGAGTPERYLRTQGGALLHVYEELAQHRGQMEGCRDVLRVPWARSVRQGVAPS